jgi:hypothetical protein
MYMIEDYRYPQNQANGVPKSNDEYAFLRISTDIFFTDSVFVRHCTINTR